jgi:membrane-associated protein
MAMIVSPDGEAPSDPVKRRRAEVACIAGIAIKTILALVLLPLTPSLLGTDPVLLEALRGSTSSMVAGGAFARVGDASLVLALLAPLPTLLFVTPFYWWAGRLWGTKAATVMTGGHPNAERWANRAAGHLERFGAVAVALSPVLPIPAAFIYAAAGWTGMSLRRFLFFDVLGWLCWVGLIVGLGYGIGHPAVHVAKDISHYGLFATIALVFVVVAITMVKAQRAGAFDPEPSDKP